MTKILIADDEEHIRILTEAIFKDLGMDVTTAVDGADAIQKVQEIKPDIVITDVVMPNQNGFEVCKYIRNSDDFSHIPVLILSAMGDEYNKITGFEEGADDYVTKPFNVEELKARVKSLLIRHQKPSESAYKQEAHKAPQVDAEAAQNEFDLIPSGNSALDKCLGGGIPRGSNILVIGSLGSGKSSLGRSFISSGVNSDERCLFVALDDDPSLIRQQLDRQINTDIAQLIDEDLIHFVDAYSWSSLSPAEDERFAVRGMLDLNQLSGAISDASMTLGQSVQNKMGGRRVIDSISSLLINFELPAVQRFLNQIARTSIAFGHVTTLFIIEDGTASDQVLNNIKYVVDGVIEMRENDSKRQIRVSSMKWISTNRDWHDF